MKKILERLINIFIKILPIRQKKLLFQSGRTKVDCAPFAIYKYIKENCPKDFKCIWLIEKNADHSMLDENDYCFYRTLKGLYHQATAKYWIRSQSIGGIIKKRSHQIYLQVWHGGGPFKKCGYDCVIGPHSSEPMDHVKEWDYYLATDEGSKDCMISGTNYNGKTLVIGNADTDLLINYTEKDKIAVLKELNLLNNKKKIILYAPTFRDNELSQDNKNFDIHIKKLEELDDYLILLRLHPQMAEIVSKLELPKNFINVSDYPNIVYLYLITDILITDYSSIIFPYAILNKKIILYPYDFEDYIKLRGGFYIDYQQLPGPICYNEEELIYAIENYDEERYKLKIKDFNKKYNYLNDGKVCQRIVEKIKSGYFEEYK